MRRRGSRLRAIGFIPQDFLTSEWKLEETTGTTAYDSKGINNGTASVDLSNLTEAGFVGNRFNFLNQRGVVVPANASLEVSDGTTNKSFSISFWQKITEGSSAHWAMGYSNGSSIIWWWYAYQNIWRLKVYNSDGSSLFLEFPTSGLTALSSGIDDGKHITLVFNPNEVAGQHIKGYVNGEKNPNSNSGTINILKTDPLAKLTFGADPRSNNLNSSGVALDEIKYYVGKALTQEESLGIYNTEK